MTLRLAKSFICFFLFAQGAVAQEFVYQPLKASGEMPDDFAKNKIDLFLDQEKEISRNQKRRDFNEESDFILYSVFTISSMMNNGSVLYNDELTTYVNEVADKVLADDQDLRSKLRFYTLKSPEINAFSTQQGIIFVTTGLISQLETEAQLAFVLAHETSHFEREHNLNTYKEKGKIGSSRYLDPDEKLSNYFNYKQENELEADEDGVKRFLKTGYNTGAINQSFNVLLYSYLPFDEMEFDYAYVENKGAKIPEKMRLEEVQEISAYEEVDDENSTHPNIKKRKARVNNLLPAKEEGEDFLVSKERYLYLQRLSRYAITDQHLKVANYARAFYNAYLIGKKYGDEKMSKKYAAMSMYGLAKFKKAGNASEVYDNYKDVEGESQRIHYLFKRMDRRSSATLAVKLCWEYHLAYPEDELMKRVADDALLLLPKAGISKNSLQTEWPGEETDEELSEDEIKKLSKYEKIEYKKKMQARKDADKYFYTYYLVDLRANETFEKALNAAYLNGGEEEDNDNSEEDEGEMEDDEVYDDDARSDQVNSWSDDDSNQGPSISRALMLRPRYDLMDHRGRVSFREMMFTTEQRELDLIGYYKQIGNGLGVELELLDDKSEFDTERFNDYCQLIEWLRERVNTNEIDMVSFCSLEMDELMDKYKADHLLLSTMNEEVDRKEFNFYYFVFAAVYVLPMPFFIYSQFQPEVSFNRNTVLFNMRNGKVEYANAESFQNKFRKDLVKAGIYNELNKIKK